MHLDRERRDVSTMKFQSCFWWLTSLTLTILLSACTPGVYGAWLIRGTDSSDIERRAMIALESQGFKEWKPLQGNRENVRERFFAHREHPVGISLRVKDNGVQVSFEENAVDRISPNGERIFLDLDEKLKAEFGPDRVVTLDVPKGLGPSS